MILLLANVSVVIYLLLSRGGGGILPWFWVRMCGWSPRTPPNSYTRPSEKHDPFIYFPYRKLTPFIYYFWKLTPFIYYFSNFTHSYTFWVKKIPHWYTFDVKMIPIHILGGLKSIPHSSRTSVYTFIMEVNPPPVAAFEKRSTALREIETTW